MARKKKGIAELEKEAKAAVEALEVAQNTYEQARNEDEAGIAAELLEEAKAKAKAAVEALELAQEKALQNEPQDKTNLVVILNTELNNIQEPIDIVYSVGKITFGEGGEAEVSEEQAAFLCGNFDNILRVTK